VAHDDASADEAGKEEAQKADASGDARAADAAQAYEAVKHDGLFGWPQQQHQQLKQPRAQVKQGTRRPLPDLRDGLLLYLASAALLLAGSCMRLGTDHERDEAGKRPRARSATGGGFSRLRNNEAEAEAADAAAAAEGVDGDNKGSEEQATVAAAAAAAAEAAALVVRGACAGLGTSAYFLVWAAKSAAAGDGFAPGWASGALAGAAAAHACGLRASLPAARGTPPARAAPSPGPAAAWGARWPRRLACVHETAVAPAHAAVAAWHVAALWHLRGPGAVARPVALYCLCAAALWLAAGAAVTLNAKRWRAAEAGAAAAPAETAAKHSCAKNAKA
jgi:SWI/SNF-related matrix-associated actin-dependent regulator 1 of chromatin subfamily A